VGRKCDKPFTMMRIEMDGTVYMCSGIQRADLNAFEVDPLEIWNSERFKALRYKLDNEEYDEICSNCHILRNRLSFDAESEKLKLNPLAYRLVEGVVVNSDGQPIATGGNIFGYIDSINETPNSLTITGWAADFDAGKPCKLILVFIDGIARAVGHPSFRRNDVAIYFERPRLGMSGYSIVVSVAEETMTTNRRIQVFALDVADHIGELPYLFAPARDDDVTGQEAEKPRSR
jgi:radical SAM protein with 4Fe4S-binding SPASM domain